MNSKSKALGFLLSTTKEGGLIAQQSSYHQLYGENKKRMEGEWDQEMDEALNLWCILLFPYEKGPTYKLSSYKSSVRKEGLPR